MKEKELEIIKNLLVGAFEGGSNYWYCIESHNKNEISGCEYLSQLLAYEGAVMTISDSEGQLDKPIEITHSRLLEAWNIFKTDNRYAKHYADAVNETDDGTTADVLLQIAVFNEVIYG